MNREALALQALIIVAIVAVCAMTLQAQPWGEAAVAAERAQEYCRYEHNATVINIATFGDGGGLHCKLRNGSVTDIPPEVLDAG